MTSLNFCLLALLTASQIINISLAADGPAVTTAEFQKARETPPKPHDPNLPPPPVDVSGRRSTGRNYVSLTQTKRWPKGRLPYTLSASMTASQRLVVATAINQIQDSSCITIVPKLANDTDYLYIDTGSSATGGCYSLGAGYTPGRGQHYIFLNTTCYILHVLGALHEQSRPDRSDFININWLNVLNGQQNQFYKAIFEGTTAPAVCPSVPAANGTYDSCYSGAVVTKDGYPYDYFSVMQYFNAAFSKGTGDTMTSKNPNVGAFGGTFLSTLDKYKLNRAYNCSNFVPFSCGGFQTGTSGIIVANGTQTACQWDIVVDPGYIIELNFNVFSFSNCVDNVLVYENGLDRSRTYCSTNVPTVTYSSGREIAIRMKRATPTNTFVLTWRVTQDQCCKTVAVNASAKAQISTDPNLTPYLGTYSQNGTSTGNGKFPIYVNQARTNFWFARWDSTYPRPWVMSFLPNAPGGNAGSMFFGPGTNCPTTVTSYQYYNYTAAGWAVETQPFSIDCTTVCTSSPPAAPANSVATPQPKGASVKAYASVVYTCNTSGFKLFSTCKPDGTWTTILGSCPTITVG